MADFGLVTISYTQGVATTSDATGQAGTVRWMAPELHRSGGKRSRDTDCYALGMTMLEVRKHTQDTQGND